MSKRPAIIDYIKMSTLAFAAEHAIRENEKDKALHFLKSMTRELDAAVIRVEQK